MLGYGRHKKWGAEGRYDHVKDEKRGAENE